MIEELFDISFLCYYTSTITILMENSRTFLLDEKCDKIDHVPGLKVNLFIHQQTVVKAMVDLENAPVRLFGNGPEKIRTSSGVLSEPVGSGKTVEVLSVILLQNTKLYRTAVYSTNLIWFKKFKHVFKPTLIIVASSVLDQWTKAIEQFTNLKFFVISNIGTLTTFIDMVHNKTINMYNVVLIKNGTVTKMPHNFQRCYDYITGTPYGDAYDIIDSCTHLQKPHIYTIVASICNICWNRVVIDDFDVIKLPQDSKIINASFTWYISSTVNNRPVRSDTMERIKDTTTLLLHQSSSCLKILKTKQIYDNFNIRNSPEFLQQSSELSIPLCLLHIVPNKNDILINALLGIDIPNMEIITDMLNADAINDASEKLGIKATSVIEIFEYILGNQYTAFKSSIEILAFIETQKDVVLFSSLPTPPVGCTYKKEDLIELKPIRYNYPKIKQFLDEYEERYTNIKNTSSGIIERMRDNLLEGECPICLNNLSDEREDIIIFKCCNIVTCGKCCFSVIFKQVQSKSPCVNCRAEITIKDIVYLNNLDFKYDELLDRIDKKNISSVVFSQEVKKPCEQKEINPEESNAVITKISVIIDILKSNHQGKKIKLNASNIVMGPGTAQISNIKKVLIFGGYDGPLKELLTAVSDLGFSSLFLRGTHKQISSIADKFNKMTENCVLFINSMNYCSGLNLQTATELIFMHYIVNQNVETQVIGRAQRLGRQNKLQIHYVAYKNEMNQMPQERLSDLQ